MEPLACVVGLPNRLHAHTIADKSGFIAYLPGASGFVAFCARHDVPVRSVGEKDRALADCLAWMCHAGEAELQAGNKLFYGVLWAFPELKASAPHGRRA